MSHTNIKANDVRSTLAKHILADGYDMVLDLDKSHGSYLVDKVTKKEYLDFFTFFASNPLGMNHPALDNDEFIRRIGKAAINKPSNSDIYTEYMALVYLIIYPMLFSFPVVHLQLKTR
jgi:L-lysine 6-transaminase